MNFTVTEKGLEDQLLALVVRKERPDLAELGEALVEQQNGFKIKMRELEDHILYKLATAEGDSRRRRASPLSQCQASAARVMRERVPR